MSLRVVLLFVPLLACREDEVAGARESIEQGADVVVEAAREGLERADAEVEDIRRRAEAELDGARDRVEQSAAPDDEERRLLAEAPRAIACDRDRCTVTRDYAERLRVRTGLLARQAKLVKAERDGRVVGLAVGDLGPLPRLLGFRAGDVVTSVNGVQLRSLQSVPQAYLQLRAAQRFTIEMLRDGRPWTLHVEIT
jgi:type II secretory pathway component PulC